MFNCLGKEGLCAEIWVLLNVSVDVLDTSPINTPKLCTGLIAS